MASVVVPPVHQHVQRARPALIVPENHDLIDLTGYSDAPVTVTHFESLYIDGETQLCVDDDGTFLRVNSALGEERPAISRALSRMREAIRVGNIQEVRDEGETALLCTSRNRNYYHFLFDDIGRLGFYRQLSQEKLLRYVVARPTSWQQQIFRVAGINDRLVTLSPREAVFRLTNVWVAPRGL